MSNPGRRIKQFMWGYQHFFRSSLGVGAKMVFESIGFDARPTIVLVGFRAAGEHAYDICIEPEDGPYSPDELSDVEAEADLLYRNNPESQMHYSAAHLHEKKHRELRDQMRGQAVTEALSRHAASQGQIFFASPSTRVGDYDVHVVLGVPCDALADVPQIKTTWRDRYRIAPSLVHAAIYEILHRASISLYQPDPGSGLMALGAGPSEIVRAATEGFVRSIMLCAGYMSGQDSDLLFNGISALPYEGRSGTGMVVLAQADDLAIEVLLRIRQPVRLSNTRAIRKLLEASGSDCALLVGEAMADAEVYALGRIGDNYDATTETVFVVSLLGRGAWDLLHENQALLSVRDGVARLPVSVLDVSRLADLADRLLPDADVPNLLELAHAASENEHGAMLVISSDAKAEAERLSPQAWAVQPTLLGLDLLRHLTAMDGAVLVDPKGHCHAIGVILDGRAAGQGDPARGSRFNNAVRYLDTQPPPAVIVVYSADGSIDILPKLHPRVRRSVVKDAVRRYVELAAEQPPSLAQVAEAFGVVKSLRFYLSADQCESVNEAAAVIDEWRKKNSSIRIVEPRLTPSPDMNDSYWLD